MDMFNKHFHLKQFRITMNSKNLMSTSLSSEVISFMRSISIKERLSYTPSSVHFITIIWKYLVYIILDYPRKFDTSFSFINSLFFCNYWRLILSLVHKMEMLRSVSGSSILILAILIAWTNICNGELEVSPDTIINEQENVTLWCATGNW